MLICIFFFLSAIYISLRWWDHFASFNFAEMNFFFLFGLYIFVAFSFVFNNSFELHISICVETS